MAEGGGFGFEVPDPDTDDQVKDDDDKGDTTQPFQPPAASTPYHGGEHHEMQTFRGERSWPPSYEETPLLIGDDLTKELERRLRELRYNSETGLLNTKGLVLPENH